jgi:hypothetical protein
MNNCKIWCVSFNNDKYTNQMMNRFETIGVDYKINDGSVSFSKSNDKFCVINRAMLHQLQNIKEFLDSDYEYGIFSEYDVYIHKDFKKIVTDILPKFEEYKLDVLLLGYLFCEPIDKFCPFFGFKFLGEKNNYKFFSYPDDLWGAQMFLINKTYAKYLLDTYNEDYAHKEQVDSSLKPFSPDWTFTKDGKRAMLYPMIAVENGEKEFDHLGHKRLHHGTTKMFYDPEYFI